MDGDLETIAAPIDFLGVNYYQPAAPAGGRPGEPAPRRGATAAGHRGDVVEYRPERPRADQDGLADRPRRPVRAAHCGSPRTPRACRSTSPRTAARPRTTSTRTGEVNDLERVKFLHLHLAAVRPRDQGRREPGRLLRLVAARQLRVGLGATRSGSGSCSSTSPPSSGSRRRAPTSMARGGAGQRGPAAARRLAGVTARHFQGTPGRLARAEMRSSALATSAAGRSPRTAAATAGPASASLVTRHSRHSTWPSRLISRALPQRGQRARSRERRLDEQSGQISTCCSRTTPWCHGLGLPGSGSIWRVPHL